MKIAGRSNYKPGPKDEAGTPPYAILTILDHIEECRKRIGKPKDRFLIWEPAIGFADKDHPDLYGAMIDLGYAAIGTKSDFLTTNLPQVSALAGHGLKVDMIVTNPPFSVAMKRRFIERSEYFYKIAGIPYALLMGATTLVEKINGKTLRGCSLHVPNGRICYDMPNKGWGTEENPTTATFETCWYSKGLAETSTIHYNDFDVSKHFDALKMYEEMYVKNN